MNKNPLKNREDAKTRNKLSIRFATNTKQKKKHYFQLKSIYKANQRLSIPSQLRAHHSPSYSKTNIYLIYLLNIKHTKTQAQIDLATSTLHWFAQIGDEFTSCGDGSDVGGKIK